MRTLARFFAALALLLLGLDLLVWFMSALRAAVDPVWFWGLVGLRIFLGLGLIRGGLHPRRLYGALRFFAAYAFGAGALLSSAVWRWYACADLGLVCNLLGFWRAAPPPSVYLIAGLGVAQLGILSLLLPRSRNFG